MMLKGDLEMCATLHCIVGGKGLYWSTEQYPGPSTFWDFGSLWFSVLRFQS